MNRGPWRGGRWGSVGGGSRGVPVVPSSPLSPFASEAWFDQGAKAGPQIKGDSLKKHGLHIPGTPPVQHVQLCPRSCILEVHAQSPWRRKSHQPFLSWNTGLSDTVGTGISSSLKRKRAGSSSGMHSSKYLLPTKCKARC